MSSRPWKYRGVWLTLLALVGIIVLSIFFDAGYVLLVWLGWQLQTTAVLFMFLLVVVVAGLVYLIRRVNSWIKSRLLRHPRHIDHYQQLLRFEQLGCLWLLDAKTSKQQDIERIFSQSATLKQLVIAHLQRENGQYPQAWQTLKSGTSLPDLCMLETASLYLAERRFDEAREQLVLIAQQPVSPFVQSLQPAWQQMVVQLWATLAQAAPWLVLETPQRPYFSATQQLAWLSALQQQLNAPVPVQSITPAQQAAVLALYKQQREQPDFLQELPSAVQWLLLLNSISDVDATVLAQHRLELADELLGQQFDPRVLSIWLHDQLRQANPDAQHIEQQLQALAQRYPGQPSIALAQWHQFKASGQEDAARQILQNWPQHADFSYLRLKEALADQAELLADLDIMYEYLKR
ncbi:hypothetical protein ACF3NA_00710 [Alkanindiges sp. WGS2144]|uniref:hypothetical protein n=1 Tax=Alkanindiges sp. WGS2144 TaxID=3366808 RepID=UPI003753D72A